MKRIIIIISILLLVAAAAILFWKKDEITFSKDVSPYRAVPVSTPVFLEINRLDAVKLDNPIIKDLNLSGVGTKFWSFVQTLQKKVAESESLSDDILKNPLIIAYDFSGKMQPVTMLIKKIKEKNDRLKLKAFIADFFPASDYTAGEKDYSKNTIYVLKGEKDNAYYAFVDGLFLFSNKLLLVEKSIRQLKSVSLLDSQPFVKVSKTITSQSDASWFINHQQFPVLLGKLMNKKYKTTNNEFGENLKNSPEKIVQKFKDFGAWTELDLSLNNNNLSLNGVTFAKDSLHHFLASFDNQKSIRYKADELLPGNTAFYLSYSFSDKEQFFSNLESYFSHSPDFYKREIHIKKIDKFFKSDILSFFKTYAAEEIIMASTTIPANIEAKVAHFVVPLTNVKEAAGKLKQYLQNYKQKKGIKSGLLQNEFSPDKEHHFTIYKFPYPSLPQILLGEPFSYVKAAYVTFYKDNLVFCNTTTGLQEYLRNLVANNTLYKDVNYQIFKDEMNDKANVTFYANVNRSYQLQKMLFEQNKTKKIEKSEENWRKFNDISWQVNADNGLFFNSILVNHIAAPKEEARTDWESSIGKKIINKPFIANNHNNKEKRNILFQDEQFNLYQLSNNGKISWKIKLDGAILSDIHQIDFYKNNKLQYLFNTKNKLYLLDIAGNSVKGFPRKLKSPATNGINVFDYDNNRNYRYFVAGEDHKIYAYDQNGTVLKGWDFDKKTTTSDVTTPIEHFRIGNKDYIVFKDQSQIYLQNRRGATRVKHNAKFTNSDNPLILNLTGKPKIVATATNGDVYYIFFDGQSAKKLEGNYSASHKFAAVDINGNNIIDFVYADGNRLTIVDENGNTVFKKKLDNNIEHQPTLFTFNKKEKKIGIVDAKANRIYLYNADGELYNGFPLQGNSSFSIGKFSHSNNTLHLIVGAEGGNVFNYTLN